MKKYKFIIGLSVLVNFSLFGQDFISFEKQWNVRLVGFPYSYTTEIFRIDGDSTVNSTNYSKIWISYDSLSSWSFQGLLREEADVVYYMPPNLSEGILYDFSLEIGDTAFVRNIFCGDAEIPIYVIDIDTIEYFGISRKRWHLGENDYVEEYWLEGIGSLNGPLYTKYWYCIVCPVWELLCYHENDILNYIFPGEPDCYQNTVGIKEIKKENNFLIKPNPVRKGELIQIEMTTKPEKIEIFTESGVLIKRLASTYGQMANIETNNFEAGLYLIRITNKEKKIETHKILIE